MTIIVASISWISSGTRPVDFQCFSAKHSHALRPSSQKTLNTTRESPRLAKAIHEEVYQRLKHDDGLLPATVEGEGAARWVLMDYLDCVLHVFVPELRDRYRLEVLWGEAPRLQLGAEADARGRTAAQG